MCITHNVCGFFTGCLWVAYGLNKSLGFLALWFLYRALWVVYGFLMGYCGFGVDNLLFKIRGSA